MMYDTLQSNGLESRSKKKQSKMNKCFHKKFCSRGAVQIYLEPTPIPLIESKNYAKLDTDCAKMKKNRDPTSKKSNLCEF